MSSAPSSISAESCQGPFEVSCLPYRAGTLPFPKLPYEYKPAQASDEYQSFGPLLSEELRSAAESILLSHGISLSAPKPKSDEESSDDASPVVNQPELLLRTRSGYRDEKVVLSINADWTQDSRNAWPSAVIDIKKKINELLRDVGASHIDIGVEIMDPEVSYPKYISPVEHNEQLLTDWEIIRERVYSELQNFDSTRDHMTMINISRYGISPDESKNPITVFVAVYEDSDESGWFPVIEAIEGYLKTFPYDLKLHLEHNSCYWAGCLWD